MERIKSYLKIMDGETSGSTYLRNAENFFDSIVGSEVDEEGFYQEHLRPRLLEAFNGINSGLIVLSPRVEECFTFLFKDNKASSGRSGIVPLLFSDILEEYKLVLRGRSRFDEFFVELSFFAFYDDEVVNLTKPLGTSGLRYNRSAHQGVEISSLEGFDEKQLVIYEGYYEFMKQCSQRLLKLCNDRKKSIYLSTNSKARDLSSNLEFKIFVKDKNKIQRMAKISILNIFSCGLSLFPSSSTENIRFISGSMYEHVFLSVVRAIHDKKSYVPFGNNFFSESLKKYFYEFRTSFVSLYSTAEPFTEQMLKTQSVVKEVESSFTTNVLSEVQYKLLYYRYLNNYIKKCIASKITPFQEHIAWKERVMGIKKTEEIEEKRRDISRGTLARLRQKLLNREKLKNEAPKCLEEMKFQMPEGISLIKIKEMAERVNALEGPLAQVLAKLEALTKKDDEQAGAVSLHSRRSLISSNIVEEVDDVIRRFQNTLPELSASLTSLNGFLKMYLAKETLEELVNCD